jgi:hypothetical protein
VKILLFDEEGVKVVRMGVRVGFRKPAVMLGWRCTVVYGNTHEVVLVTWWGTMEHKGEVNGECGAFLPITFSRA